MKQTKERLKKLYPDKYEETYEKLVKMLDDFRKNNPSQESDGPIFSEKDVMLICYADHVQEKGVKTFKTMKKFLDKYAKGIVNRIHFLPFYDCSDWDDGFSIKNYYMVHKPYGDWRDLEAMKEDFSFMFDLVLNHASIQGDVAERQLKGDESVKDFFHFLDEEIDTSKVFRPRTHPLFTEVKDSKGDKKYAWTTFSEDQIDWNYSNPEVLLEMINTLLFYFGTGAQAIRLDAVAYIWKKINSTCFDLPECHTVVQIFRDVFREAAPHNWAIAETVLPHEKNIEYFGDGHNESHFVYNFVLETLLMHTFLEGSSELFTKQLRKMENDFNEETSMLNLSVSHDGVHVIPAKGVLSNEQMMAVAKDSEAKGGKVLYRTLEGGEGKTEPYELNITYPSAIGGVEKYLASQAIQMSLKGVPLIYLNNLIGAENWSEGVEKLKYSRAINREKFDFEKLSGKLDDKSSKQHKIYEGYKKMLEVRTSEPLFSPLADQKMQDLDESVVAILREKDGEKLLALINVSEEEIELDNEKIKSILGRDSVKDILNDVEFDLDKKVKLDSYQVVWMK